MTSGAQIWRPPRWHGCWKRVSTLTLSRLMRVPSSSVSAATQGNPGREAISHYDRTGGTLARFIGTPMLALLSLALLAAAPLDAADPDSTDRAAALVRQVVTNYVAPLDPTPEAHRWQIAWADVNNDGLEDAIVLAGDPDWCGSGGCALLVLEAIAEFDQGELGPYVVAAEIDMVNGPIRLSAERNVGWYDLLVQSEEGETRRLQFDGETYPFSPADGIASGDERGTVLFAAAD